MHSVINYPRMPSWFTFWRRLRQHVNQPHPLDMPPNIKNTAGMQNSG